MTNLNIPNNFTAIKCPHCGMEYLPCEIFYPKYLLGVPKSIIRDPLGKILMVDWEEKLEPTLEESFVCEHCDHAFVISADIIYKTTEEDEALDFKHQTVSLF